ncbi:Type 1 glutamine amidotransferase-like domain-containing protein [Paenibacillus sedimenti]|uniref:Type 1 glutamine amidotransferase-like domain-containing protein n=1 Tax=Paenibacillus sedimenti TaxID=2770274 RepID=A0A926QNK2_9BACL|nr:Type 1 glutamine amidotransferase-like domain-containing protein [Paenibacillus sedimenti]MBD0384882.1 Type 1 glutamine amidotransferase-like domain-containing protein [Paenibacillus sedimenti]
MMQIFLTAKAFLHDLDVFNHFIEFVENQKIEKRIITITTAQMDLSARQAYEVSTRDIFLRAGFIEVDFLDVQSEEPTRLRDFPIICIGGGNPFHLLNQIKKSKTDQILLDLRNKGHLIIGHSSGAAVLGETIQHANLLHPKWNTIHLTDFTAIGMIREVILPHSNRYSVQEDTLKEYERSEHKKLLKIEDGDYILVS